MAPRYPEAPTPRSPPHRRTPSYASGVTDSLPTTGLRFPDAESVDEAVYRVLEAVPPGSVTSYGRVAALLGLATPRRPAAAMRRCPDSLPWWRMVRSDGSLPAALAARAAPEWAREGTTNDGARAHRSAFWAPSQTELGALFARLSELGEPADRAPFGEPSAPSGRMEG